MAQTFDIGPYFAHRISLRPDAPRVHRAITQEVDEPYRVSNSRVIRIARGFGLVLGRWRNSGKSEEEALLAALGRETDIAPLIERWEQEL